MAKPDSASQRVRFADSLDGLQDLRPELSDQRSASAPTAAKSRPTAPTSTAPLPAASAEVRLTGAAPEGSEKNADEQ